MPIYEFRCTRCDNLFDRLQNADDDDPVCPVCGSEVMRIFSSMGLRFKGSGFHSTDYSKRGPRKRVGINNSKS